MYPSRCVDPAQVSPRRIALERCGLRSLGAGFVLDLAGVKIVKGKEREGVGTVSLWLRVPLTQKRPSVTCGLLRGRNHFYMGHWTRSLGRCPLGVSPGPPVPSSIPQGALPDSQSSVRP